MTLLCVTLQHISHTYLHMHQWGFGQWGFGTCDIMKSYHSGALSSALFISTAAQCPLHECSLVYLVISLLRLFQTKPPIHSYLLPCTYEQVPVLRMGFLSQGEQKCWYSTSEPPSAGSPGLIVQGQGWCDLPAPVSETVSGSPCYYYYFFVGSWQLCSSLIFVFTPHAEKLKPRFYQAGCDELW